MSPLSKATIATVGSGVMAEAMIAGLLRGQLVEPGQVVASHPRPERREHLEREYGIRTVAGNVEAVTGADVILFGIKPQMLGKVGREIGPHLRRGQLVLSVLAGATTTALTGILGHDQVVRSMPNTPARLGKGMTVWYATPETTDEQRAQAAALLGALGVQLEVDDEKMVAMATAVSGTGPTYVFLVMEALIDAAVHLGFPRHIAHDLVIETLEGSTLFAKQSGMHPAELRNMVTSPGGTSAAALHELESGRLRTVLSEAVWAAFHRTVELGDQLERSAAEPEGRPERRAMTDVRRRGRGPATGALADVRGRDLRAPGVTCGTTRPRSGIASAPRGPGLTMRPGTCPGAAPSDAGGPDWSLADHVAHIAAWQELAIEYTERAIETGQWPSDTDFDGGDFDRYNERLCGAVDDAPAGRDPAPPRARRDRLLEVAHRLGDEAIRGDAAWGWVYMTLHGHYLDHLAVIEPWTERLRGRQIDGDPFVEDPRTGDADDFDARRRRTSGTSTCLWRPFPSIVGTGDDDPRLDAARSIGHLADWADRGRPGDRDLPTPPALAGGPGRRASMPGTSGWWTSRAARPSTETLTRYREASEAMHDAVDTLSRDELRSPDGWSWAYDRLHGHLRKHLAMIGPWAATLGWPERLRT